MTKPIMLNIQVLAGGDPVDCGGFLVDSRTTAINRFPTGKVPLVQG